MESLTFGRTALCLTLLNFILAYDGCPRKSVRVERPRAPAAAVETRGYRADNGYELSVTSLGGIVGLRGPKRPGAEGVPARDYYRLTYQHRRGRQVVASTVPGGDNDASSRASDFVPVSFESPPSGTVFSDDRPLTAKATVHTSDGLLRLTHLLTWKPGSDSVSVQTEIAKLEPGQDVSVIAFERGIEVAWGETVSKNQDSSVARHGRVLKAHQGYDNGLLLVWGDRCIPAVPHCPPPPPLKPYLMMGDPAPLVRWPVVKRLEAAAGKTRNAEAAAGQQSDGATAAGLVWEFKSSASRQTPPVLTTRFELLDNIVP